MVKKLRRNLQT